MKKRILVVSDIHGHYDELKSLMQRVRRKYPFKDLWRIVFVGDYIDRGPQSFEVVKYVMSLQKRYGTKIVALKGNHEDMILTDYQTWMYNGGPATKRSYAEHGYEWPNYPKDHMEFFRNAPTHYDTRRYFFAHGGVNPDRPLDDQNDDDLMWIRWNFLESRKDFGKQVIVGHTPHPYPFVEKNKIDIDTLMEGGYITGLILPDLIFFRSKTWAKPLV